MLQQQGADLDWKTFHFWTSNQFTYILLKGLGFNIELRKDVPAPDSTPQPQDPQSTGLTAEEQNMFDLVNKERLANGLEPLEIDMRLVETARLKSTDMVKLDYFDHQSPTYGSPFDMMKAFGITYSYAGENLAGAPNVNTAHVNLMNSPGHRANILNPNYTHVGIGIFMVGKYGMMFTQQFINPGN